MLGGLLVAGCATTLDTRVTSFNQWPTDAAGGTFGFISPRQAGRELEQANYESLVAAELGRLGLKQAPAGTAARFHVEVQVAARSEVRSFMRPVYQDQYVLRPAFRDRAGRIHPGYWAPDPFGPLYVGEQAVQRTVWLTSLRLRILDTAKSAASPTAVFESEVVHEGDRDAAASLVPWLVRAVFDEFPGQNGRVRRVRFDSETGAVIRPRTAPK